MAGSIKGITIEIGGDSTKLQKALRDVDTTVRSSTRSLKDINKSLKLDPSNTTLLVQKQKELKNAIQATKEKLQILKDAAKQVTPEQIGQDKYDALQQEIGETEAKLKSLENEYKQFGSVSKQKLEAAAAKMKEVGDALAGAGQTLSTYVTAPIVGAGAVAVKTSADFESSMSKVSAISGATGDDLQALKDKAREMGMSTKFSASESADAMSYMAMAGWKTDQMISGLPGILNLAAASGEDLATTSDIVTDALTAFGLKAEDSGHFADVLAAASSNANTNVSMMGESFKYAAPTAGALGYSAEDVAIALGLMANQGIKSSQAGTALNAVFTRMAKPTKDSETAMNRLGISLADSEGNMYSFREIMDQMRDSFGQINMPVEEFNTKISQLDADLEDGTITQSQYDKELEELTKQAYGAEGAEKARAAAMLAGQRGMPGLLALVNASAEDYEKLTSAVDGASDTFVKTADGSIKTMSQALADGDEIVEEYSGTTEKMASVVQDNLNGKLTVLKSSLGELAIAFGETLTPAVEKVTEIIQKVTDKLNQLTPGQRQVISVILAVIAAIGPLLLIVGKALIFASQITMAVATLQPILAEAGAAIAALSGPILIVVGVIAGLVAAGVLLYKNWDTIKQKASEVGAWLQQSWQVACESVQNVVSNAKTIISQKWDEMKTAVVNKATEISTNAKQKFEEIRSNIAAKVELARSTVTQKFDQIKTGISTRIENAKTVVSTKIDAIKTKLSSVAPSAILGKFDQIKNGIRDKINAAKTAVTTAIANIKSAFNFTWSLPHLKLPSIGISGGFSLNPPSVPHFTLNWHRKAMNVPFMLDGAQIFGTMGNKALAGGEAGRELIVGWDALKQHLGGGGTTVINNSITVNAAPGMDERQVADAVMRRMQTEINRKGRVWA